MAHLQPWPWRENQAQMARWSVNTAPDWHFPPLAIANQYKDRETGQLKRQRYRLVLVKCSRYEWIARDRRDEVCAAVTSKHPWTPEQTLPSGFNETILFGYAADATPLPTYICLPSGLHRSRTGRMVEREGKRQEIISLPGIFFFDGWRVQPSLTIPANVPQTKDAPDRGIPPGTPRARTKDKDDARQPEEEARDILAAAYRNQAENGPNTRRAAIRACKYLKVLVDRHGTVIHKVHQAARVRNRAKARRQPNSSTLPVAPCLKSPLSLHPNYYTASTQYLTHGQCQKLPLIWKNRRNGSQRCVGFISQTSMPEKLKESQPPTRHREWKILCEKCNNSYHTWRRRWSSSLQNRLSHSSAQPRRL